MYTHVMFRLVSDLYRLRQDYYFILKALYFYFLCQLTIISFIFKLKFYILFVNLLLEICFLCNSYLYQFWNHFVNKKCLETFKGHQYPELTRRQPFHHFTVWAPLSTHIRLSYRRFLSLGRLYKDHFNNLKTNISVY